MMPDSPRPRRTTRTRFLRTAAVIATLVATVLVAPAPAQAAPAGCSTASRFTYVSDARGSHAANFSGFSYGAPFCLQSPDLTHYVIFQNDGNLVLYSSRGGRWHATWNTGTFSSSTSRNASRLAFQDDGNMVLYNDGFDGVNDTVALWNSGTFGSRRADFIQIQNDGNLVLYNGSRVAQWSSGTGGR